MRTQGTRTRQVPKGSGLKLCGTQKRSVLGELEAGRAPLLLGPAPCRPRPQDDSEEDRRRSSQKRGDRRVLSLDQKAARPRGPPPGGLQRTGRWDGPSGERPSRHLPSPRQGVRPAPPAGVKLSREPPLESRSSEGTEPGPAFLCQRARTPMSPVWAKSARSVPGWFCVDGPA